ncbi:MAG: ABC transporter substrate-binding protein [Mangrovibacterium sp.]|nr:ABC transporter substrate-binding protein [Mangrovibacterium sp.]
MKHQLEKLWLAVALIVGASAILLLSDLEQRHTAKGTEVSGMNNQPDKFPDLPAGYGMPAKIALVTLVENPILEQAIAGVEDALNESGLVDRKDYLIKKYSAQGEIGQLPQIIDAIILEKPDAVITVTTPALIAATAKIHDIPVVFTVASDPYKLQIFKEGKEPANICGVHDNPPVDRLLEMASRSNQNLRKSGIIYDAAQANSLISVEKLRAAGKEQHIHILEVTASSVSDLGPAAQSLIQRGAEAFILSADNLVLTGFPAILRVAKGAGVPIYVTEPDFVSQGASGAIGDDYYEWGKQSGQMAAKVLAGVPPANLPITETKNQRIIEPK